jgi:hypothetical protein
MLGAMADDWLTSGRRAVDGFNYFGRRRQQSRAAPGRWRMVFERLAGLFLMAGWLFFWPIRYFLAYLRFFSLFESFTAF